MDTPTLLLLLVLVQGARLGWDVYRDVREADYLLRLSVRAKERG